MIGIWDDNLMGLEFIKKDADEDESSVSAILSSSSRMGSINSVDIGWGGLLTVPREDECREVDACREY